MLNVDNNKCIVNKIIHLNKLTLNNMIKFVDRTMSDVQFLSRLDKLAAAIQVDL